MLSHFHAGKMAKQVHLKPDEFVDAINCPLSQDEYYRLLRERIPDLRVDS
jgi:hypothetical protein